MSELKQKLKQFIITEVNPERNLEQIEDDEPLLESGIVDSLGVLKILGFLDEEFGIDLSADQVKLERFKDISSICALVEQGKK